MVVLGQKEEARGRRREGLDPGRGGGARREGEAREKGRGRDIGQGESKMITAQQYRVRERSTEVAVAHAGLAVRAGRGVVEKGKEKKKDEELLSIQ
jgi:hypothetical protein